MLGENDRDIAGELSDVRPSSPWHRPADRFQAHFASVSAPFATTVQATKKHVLQNVVAPKMQGQKTSEQPITYTTGMMKTRHTHKKLKGSVSVNRRKYSASAWAGWGSRLCSMASRYCRQVCSGVVKPTNSSSNIATLQCKNPLLRNDYSPFVRDFGSQSDS